MVDYTVLFSFPFYRLAVGVPLDGITKREILEQTTTWRVIRSTPVLELRRGFQPNAVKYLTSSYLQFGSTWVASYATPVELPPAMRGIMIGMITSSMEASVKNIWNVLVTRFIQGQGWSVLKQEGTALLTRGLSPALLHRGLSSSIYWGLYEPLHKRYPEHTFAVGSGVGVFQVCATAPFYITAVRRQAKLKEGEPPLPKSLTDLFKLIARTEGVGRGLFLRGVVPRLVHSALTSGPLMFTLEKYNLIHR